MFQALLSLRPLRSVLPAHQHQTSDPNAREIPSQTRMDAQQDNKRFTLDELFNVKGKGEEFSPVRPFKLAIQC